ncbi:helix-turn-helix transcriptional regulator [Salmonella enterica]|uniref:helix-turn-helix domain-containing protein n=1 Tax=Salmonella enterica TaxID=28901 RepID=UPI0003BCEC4A|nr:helix-turn-helix transcriptional regulator [Salmonella enterica]EBH8909637.1 XRE family transcriptional regulator [Salmonella enterica subsp. enterica serovar Santiago]EBK2763502.1 helix-turn-helix transcriptional regulator [Salmonella enterica subsp. enterica serovar Muenchen]ECF6025253.1 helix-turn-helix transcriptional regulator [Salmonella enterica subsp. houtenae]EDQ2834985.1 helix-turn-helix transcriptional regulator [Salmonella enterica subsp. enterica]EDX6461608.1 helix-turn-helix t
MQIFDRLRNERERLGLSQTAMSKVCNVAFRTYCDYEAGKSEPKASTLASLAEFGVDILFVLSGVKTPKIDGISEDEQEIVKMYREAPLAVKAAVLGALTAGISASGSVNVSGSGNRIAGRDYHEKKK